MFPSEQSSNAHAVLNKTNSEKIDILEIWNIIRRRKQVILGAVILSLGAAFLYIYNAVPQYVAQTTLLLDARQQNILDGSAVLAGLTGDTAVIESQVEIIRSRNLLERVANKYNLYDDGEFATQGFISSLLGDKDIDSVKQDKATNADKKSDSVGTSWTQNILAGLNTSETKTKLSPNEISRNQELHKISVLEQIDERLVVQRKGQTQALILGYRSRNPEKAQMIVSAIADAYLNDQLEAKLEATQRATKWLDERLSGLRKELNTKEEAIVQFKQRNNLFSVQGTTQIEQQVARLNEQLITAKGDTAEKLAAYNQVRRLAQTGAIQSFSGVLTSNVIASLRDKEAEITRELADLSGRYGSEHPKLRNAKAQLRDIKSQISAEVRRILAGAQSEYEIARSREASLASSLNGLRSEFKNTGVNASRLTQMEREAESSKVAFESVSERFKQTDKSEQVQQSDARIISKATIPTNPVSPKKGLIYLLAAVAGLILGVGLAFLNEHLVSGFMTAENIEQTLGISVISTLHEMPIKTLRADADTDKLHEYVHKKPISLFSESIRKIRVAVEADHLSDTGGQVVLVTSSVPNEGKTQITSSYAASWANAGKKALIIDCDFRNPSIADLFNIKVEQGLGEFLTGDMNVNDMIVKNIKHNIDFIGIKMLPDSPSDIFKMPKFKALLNHLRTLYPLIILDTPPLAAVIDTAVVADYVDNIVYVTAWEKTPRKIVTASLKLLGKNKDKVSGIVLNRVNTKRDAYYGNYYGYATKNYAKYYNA